MTVYRAVITNTDLKNSTDGGPLAVATSARLALYGGGEYLQERLTRAPVTPASLTQAVTATATTLEDLGINYLANASAYSQDQLLHNPNGQILDVERQYK